MILTMHLHAAQFDLVKSGVKTVETRVNDAKRRSICVGDTLVYIHRDTNETIHATVTSIDCFNDFEPAVTTFSTRLGRSIEPVLQDLKTFYTTHEVKQHGVVVFGFKVTQ
ncbi:MAG: ASCH domain-containing protein [Alphaproteobacteria bacterium]